MYVRKNAFRILLQEDIGRGDITSELIIPQRKKARAAIITKQACLVCGIDIAREIFRAGDKKTKFTSLVKDGRFVKKATILAKIEGRARSILSAERVALNFLTLLSGIATKTRAFVKAIRPYKAQILDTRKTIPGLRILQKYAVRIGGGYNHRMTLGDMVLIKDNHIKITSAQQGNLTNIKLMAEQARHRTGGKIKVEIEVKNLSEFKEALKAAPDIIMLDGMRLSQIKKAVKIMRAPCNIQSQRRLGHPLLEASGGITLKNVKQIASTGIDIISVGGLTHSIDSIDMSLEIL